MFIFVLIDSKLYERIIYKDCFHNLLEIDSETFEKGENDTTLKWFK